MGKLSKPSRLKLNKTTIRHLTEGELGDVAGGEMTLASVRSRCEYCSNSCNTCQTNSGCPGGVA